MGYSVTRDQIVNAALACRGWRFRHQARGQNNEVDCVGLLVLVAKAVGYPNIVDVTGYRRMPSADTIRQTLLKNLDEIPIEDARKGDIYLMKLGGIEPKHAAIRISDETDYLKGIEPRMIHAFGFGNRGKVLIEAVRKKKHDIAAAFRMRGLVD